MATENTGIVLCVKKDGSEIPFDAEHPAAKLATKLKEQGGEYLPRAIGFKMTSKDGGKLGFCQPTKDGFKIYLTTIEHDNPILKDIEGIEVVKGSDNLAVITNLSKPNATLRTLVEIYEKAEAARPEKPKKEKKEKADKPAKKAKKSDDGEGNGEDKPAKKAKHAEASEDDVPVKKAKKQKVVEAEDDAE